MLIKHTEKQLNFCVLTILADYALTMQHKQILHWESKREVDYIDFQKKKTHTHTQQKPRKYIYI